MEEEELTIPDSRGKRLLNTRWWCEMVVTYLPGLDSGIRKIGSAVAPGLGLHNQGPTHTSQKTVERKCIFDFWPN